MSKALTTITDWLFSFTLKVSQYWGCWDDPCFSLRVMEGKHWRGDLQNSLIGETVCLSFSVSFCKFWWLWAWLHYCMTYFSWSNAEWFTYREFSWLSHLVSILAFPSLLYIYLSTSEGSGSLSLKAWLDLRHFFKLFSGLKLEILTQA